MPRPLKCPSIREAFSLQEHIANSTNTSAKENLKSGVLIGCGKILRVSTRQLNDIKYWITDLALNCPDEEFPNIVLEFSKVLITNEVGVGTVYQTGDVLAIRDSYTPDSEWVMELNSIISYGPIRGEFYVFVDGYYYVPQVTRGNLALEVWTGQPKLVKRTYANLCVQKSLLVERKLMLHPNPHNRDHPPSTLVLIAKNLYSQLQFPFHGIH